MSRCGFVSGMSVTVLTARLGVSLWDGVVVQQQDGAVGCCVQVLLFPRLVQITLWLQQP